jgi:hypothetical protein
LFELKKSNSKLAWVRDKKRAKELSVK